MTASFVRIILVGILILTSIFTTDRIAQFTQQNDRSHIAKALTSMYPEVGLPSPKGPIIVDPHLKTEAVFRGLRNPTSMAFLGPNDIVVTEKDTGTVRRVVNGTELQQPLLNASVATYAHRGMLGIAVASHPSSTPANHENNSGTTYVFLYYTKARTHIGDDITEGKQPQGNFLYRYELINNKLINPRMLLDLPATPGAIGNGGKVIVGPDNNVYVTIGDVGINGHNTKAQNIQNGSEPDGTSGILRVSQDGRPVLPGILGDNYPSSLYYSYGIWNSFGLAFDPVTNFLWDTQIGLPYGDEINLVDPGFNSGYDKIDGIWLRGYSMDQAEKHVAPSNPNGLVNFGGKAKYHPPQFTWLRKVVPTGIVFLNSNKMGNQYKDDMFVADDLNGNLYHFKLNMQRTGLQLPYGSIADGVANSNDSLDQIIFAKGFGGITDLKVNPYDGFLYVLTFDQGTIYRIVPASK
ncbi:MAG TPA: PQQ-dependent sugar dehydrogenase [Candidatus Nitrosopolaris sp.]|nr:PQQ-dependent sugar dehydrogenase [Candidatus Nitrosopolaris sp.]